MTRLPPQSTLFPYTTLFRSTSAGSGSQSFEEGIAHRFQEVSIRSCVVARGRRGRVACDHRATRSEEHTSELQSHVNLVCRLLLEKKKKLKIGIYMSIYEVYY